MRSGRQLICALLSALALFTGQALSVLHDVSHSHHHASLSEIRRLATADRQTDRLHNDDLADDYEMLRCTVCAYLSRQEAKIPVIVLTVIVAAAPSPEEVAPPRDITETIPRLEVASLPDQPRAPPVG